MLLARRMGGIVRMAEWFACKQAPTGLFARFVGACLQAKRAAGTILWGGKGDTDSVG